MKLLILGTTAAFIGLTAFNIHVKRTVEVTTIQVESKERLLEVSGANGSQSSNHRNFVYSNDETYVVKDNFWLWHFRAGTVYAQIPEGESTCDVTLSGWRMGFLSAYQNIIAADCTPAS